jgi:hypothetical protein
MSSRLKTSKKGTAMKQEELSTKMEQLIAKCWVEEGFKHQLLADPSATLKAEGVEVPVGLSIKVLENDDTVFHLVIPAKPTETELSDEELSRVSGGHNDLPQPNSRSVNPLVISRDKALNA